MSTVDELNTYKNLHSVHHLGFLFISLNNLSSSSHTFFSCLWTFHWEKISKKYNILVTTRQCSFIIQFYRNWYRSSVKKSFFAYASRIYRKKVSAFIWSTNTRWFPRKDGQFFFENGAENWIVKIDLLVRESRTWILFSDNEIQRNQNSYSITWFAAWILKSSQFNCYREVFSWHLWDVKRISSKFTWWQFFGTSAMATVPLWRK